MGERRVQGPPGPVKLTRTPGSLAPTSLCKPLKRTSVPGSFKCFSLPRHLEHPSCPGRLEPSGSPRHLEPTGSPDKRLEPPGLLESPRPHAMAGTGKCEQPPAAGRGLDQSEGGIHGIRGARSAELHPCPAGETGRQGAEQLGDESVLDGGREVEGVQRCARVEDCADRLQDHGVVVAEGQSPGAREAVQVAAAVRTLDGQPTGSNRDDGQGARIGARPGLARRLASQGRLVRRACPSGRLANSASHDGTAGRGRDGPNAGPGNGPSGGTVRRTTTRRSCPPKRSGTTHGNGTTHRSDPLERSHPTVRDRPTPRSHRIRSIEPTTASKHRTTLIAGDHATRRSIRTTQNSPTTQSSLTRHSGSPRRRALTGQSRGVLPGFGHGHGSPRPPAVQGEQCLASSPDSTYETPRVFTRIRRGFGHATGPTTRATPPVLPTWDFSPGYGSLQDPWDGEPQVGVPPRRLPATHDSGQCQCDGALLAVGRPGTRRELSTHVTDITC
ncbi:hypothetical protein SLINC_6210 [Streptomyces lincolnensis]|uniref:Uncharacterized protein n=1 Tax=Streptomyces lincolnensis TaxID=1915 RepID=A0A1B1MIP1_STRLN|nr:hypothetical protein SLINC_6210 [Streptomyces lincolnensis]AXG53362.1 hypothetical protein SLCG_2207 [Streptomyces lincolnensis]